MRDLVTWITEQFGRTGLWSCDTRQSGSDTPRYLATYVLYMKATASGFFTVRSLPKLSGEPFNLGTVSGTSYAQDCGAPFVLQVWYKTLYVL